MKTRARASSPAAIDAPVTERGSAAHRVAVGAEGPGSKAPRLDPVKSLIDAMLRENLTAPAVQRVQVVRVARRPGLRALGHHLERDHH